MSDTPRNIRVPDASWEAAIVKAREEGTTISRLVRVWIDRYLQAP